MDALASFHKTFSRPPGDPKPPPYLDSPQNWEAGAVDIELEVWLQTSAMLQAGSPGERLMRPNYADAYWTVTRASAWRCSWSAWRAA